MTVGGTCRREEKGEGRQEIADRRWDQKDGSLDTESEEGAEGRSEKESVVRWMRLEKRREGRGSEKGEASRMVLIFGGLL